jgi:tight adherence protein B
MTRRLSIGLITMIRFTAITIIGLVSTWALSPRCFAYFDSRHARQRLHGPQAGPSRQHASATKVTQTSALPREHNNRLVKLSAMTDLLARESRNAMPSVEMALAELHPRHPDDVMCRDLWLSCVVNGVFVSSALDHVASLMRDMAACRADVAVAASQARLSARMLSSMPFVAMALAIVFSRHFRSHLFTLPVLIPLALGIVLNRIGWAWILRLINQSLTQQASELSILIDHLCVSLRAGHTLVTSCELWEHSTTTGANVAQQLRAGHSLNESLTALEHSLGAGGADLAGVIRQANRDGLAVVATVARLSTDARAQRRRQADTLIRQLPTKLSVPLVLCVLPSFLLAAVVPLAISNLTRLTVQVPILSPPQP